MELELMPRRCPFCNEKPDCHAYRDNLNRLTMFSINCNNEYCMVQPGLQMYWKKSQYEAVKYWNGESEL